MHPNTTFSQLLFISVRHDQSKWIGKPSAKVSSPSPYEARPSCSRKPETVCGAWFNNQPSADTCSGGGYTFWTNKNETCRPVTGFIADPFGNPILDAQGQPQLTFGAPRIVNGFRLKDGRASYGVGLETFALGFPIHFDWSWRTLFNKDWEDVLFATTGGSSQFRKPRFAVWIGYDF